MSDFFSPIRLNDLNLDPDESREFQQQFAAEWQNVPRREEPEYPSRTVFDVIHAHDAGVVSHHTVFTGGGRIYSDAELKLIRRVNANESYLCPNPDLHEKKYFAQLRAKKFIAAWRNAHGGHVVVDGDFTRDNILCLNPQPQQ